LFAVIDIETTGGRPDSDRITEIAILLHDGEKVVKRYSTLINPRCKIPGPIISLTGITNEMVQDAPMFHEVARDIIEMTNDAVFVAHNVRFDYGFIKAAFKDLGYTYQRKTLCTVRLSRGAFPGLPSYSLGKLCESLSIELENRHRALGDAEATAILLGRIFEQQKHVEPEWLASESKKTSIPPLLQESKLHNIPEGITGVYYFHNQHGHVIYIGKAIDIRKRMLQHFLLNTKDSKRGMQMKNEIADISYEPTGSELLALLLESDEIKRQKPIYNVMQKKVRAIPYYGVFTSYDDRGYVNFTMERLKEGDEPFITCDNLHEARNLLYRMIEKYELCQTKCSLHHTPGPCFDHQLHKCKGACIGQEECDLYNKRALKGIKALGFRNESFFLVGKGRHENEKSVVCLEKGVYKGFGFIDISFGEPSLSDMRECIKPYAHNRDIQQILCMHMKKGHVKLKYELENLGQPAG
jgi:DNA polymerase-3 subunit epsilon